MEHYFWLWGGLSVTPVTVNLFLAFAAFYVFTAVKKNLKASPEFPDGHPACSSGERKG